MKPKIYIETSVVSYYTNCPSRDIVTVARQQVSTFRQIKVKLLLILRNGV